MAIKILSVPTVHECDLPNRRRRRKMGLNTVGTIIKCDECNTQYKLGHGYYGVEWSKLLAPPPEPISEDEFMQAQANLAGLVEDLETRSTPDEISDLLDKAAIDHEPEFPYRKFYEWRKMTDEYATSDTLIPAPRHSAHLVSSECAESELHAPVIDLDLPCRLLPSGTEGHFHLYIDRLMPFKDFEKLLKVMYEVGIVEQNYYDMARRRNAAYVRLPEKPKTIRAPRWTVS